MQQLRKLAGANLNLIQFSAKRLWAVVSGEMREMGVIIAPL